MTSFRKRAPWLFLGLADLAYRQPIRPETVADAAVRVLEQLNELRRGEFEESLGAALAEHDALWADELKDGVCDALAVQIEFHLARLLERSFDGVDMIVLKAQPGGRSAALANDVLSRSGLMGRAPARLDYATDLLRSGLSAAETFLSVARTVMGADNDLLEDDELEPPWRDADDPDALSMFFDRHADAYLDRRPDAAADQLESHLRRRLRRELAKRRRMAEGLADHGLLRHLGADDAKIAQCKLSNALHEAMKRRPISQRLDRLMLDEVSEKFLMALTHRFLNPAPDEEADADRPPSLAAFLRHGVERRFELILRIEGLGHASRYAGFLAFQSMELADFDAVETAIAHVAALAARLEAEGTPFLPPEPRRSGRRTICIGFDESERHWGDRRRLEDVVACGDPLRIARAKSVLAKALATDVQAERGVRVAQLEEAIELWRDAAAVWTREASPRQWGSLMHNVALAEDSLAEFQHNRKLRQRALKSIRLATEAFDPDEQP